VKPTINIADLFPKYLFWDVDSSKLHVQRDRALIIPRALYMTNRNSFPANIAKLEQLYSPQQIVDQLKSTKEKISNDVCKMVADHYSIPRFYRFQSNPH
jgi:hypothetical protein